VNAGFTASIGLFSAWIGYLLYRWLRPLKYDWDKDSRPPETPETPETPDPIGWDSYVPFDGSFNGTSADDFVIPHRETYPFEKVPTIDEDVVPSSCKFAAGGASCVHHCGDPACMNTGSVLTKHEFKGSIETCEGESLSWTEMLERLREANK